MQRKAAFLILLAFISGIFVTGCPMLNEYPTLEIGVAYSFYGYGPIGMPTTASYSGTVEEVLPGGWVRCTSGTLINLNNIWRVQ